MSSEEAHKCSSICPSLEFLQNEKIVTNVVCTVPNCDEIFLNLSNLNFHLEKVHKLKLEVFIFVLQVVYFISYLLFN